MVQKGDHIFFYGIHMQWSYVVTAQSDIIHPAMAYVFWCFETDSHEALYKYTMKK